MTAFLARPLVAAFVARMLQKGGALAEPKRAKQRSAVYPHLSPPRETLDVPTSVGRARVIVYRPAAREPAPAVHVNFHGGGYVMPLVEDDDPQCRFLASNAGVVVVNVDYVVAPQHPFPAATTQAYDVVQWVAQQGDIHGWDGRRLTVGGQSAGGTLAAAVARQALERGGPPIALQVLHYPPLDLVTPFSEKRALTDKPLLRPWMAAVFDSVYVPEVARRSDRLVSPAHPSETASLQGIAPALVITAELDVLREDGDRYARRLQQHGALREHVVVEKADHGYDLFRHPQTDAMYALIARHIEQATR